MSEAFSAFLLPLVLTYGAPALALALLAGAAGLPVPGSLLVIAAGAFARQGLLDWPTAGALALAGTILGDSIGFGMGFFANGWVNRHFGGTNAWQNASETFQKGGGLAVFLSRFLVTAVAVPVNLVAGSSAYSFRRFFVFAFTGEAVWIFSYGGLGYLFGSEWELVSTFLSDFGGLILGLALVTGGLLYWRHQQKLAGQ